MFLGFVLTPILLPRQVFLFQNVANQQWYKAFYDNAIPNLPPSSKTLEALRYTPRISKLDIIYLTIKITRNMSHEIDNVPATLISVRKRTNTTLNLLDLSRTAIYTTYIYYVKLTLPESEEIES